MRNELILFEKQWESGRQQILPLDKKVFPSLREISQSLESNIHISNGTVSHTTPPRFRLLPKEHHQPFQIDEIERTQVFPTIESSVTADRVLSVLLNTNIRRGKLDLIQEFIPEIRSRIQASINDDAPITLVLPSLPFKDQTPLTTRHSLGAVDLGEHLMMAQMRTIIDSIEAIYQHGAKMILLTDGLVYSNLFANNERAATEQYRRNCQHTRDIFGLRGKVELIDMEWLVNQESEFGLFKDKMQASLQELYGNDTNAQQSLNALARSMLMNVPTVGYSFNDYTQLAQLPFAELPRNLKEIFLNSAFEYASFLLTMKSLRIVERAFPDAQRTTVHPKKAPQIPLHLVNKNSAVLPYNGVPIVSERRLGATGSIRRSTRIVRFSETLEFPDTIAIHRGSISEPFYYSVHSTKH